MPSKARGAQAPSDSGGARSKKRTRVRSAEQPLEHRILLTATLCLLAFGAVMVYSASSAPTLLQGQGNGSGYLIKYLLFGGVGLVAMNVLARDGVKYVQRFTEPLLIVSFVLVLAVYVPHVGVRVNGARRWIGPGVFQFQPSELLKIALVLYTATLLAKRPKRVLDLHDLSRPLLAVVGGACWWRCSLIWARRW
jgi:cell division protein FtsW